VAATRAAMRDDDDDGHGSSRSGGSLVDFVFDLQTQTSALVDVSGRDARTRASHGIGTHSHHCPGRARVRGRGKERIRPSGA